MDRRNRTNAMELAPPWQRVRPRDVGSIRWLPVDVLRPRPAPGRGRGGGRFGSPRVPLPRGSGRGPDLVLYDPSPQNFLHVRWQRPPGSPLGVGILDANAYPGGTLGGSWAANYFASELMANPSPPAVLTHPMRLNKEQAESLQDQWITSVGRSRSIPAVLSGGITFAPLQLSARDAQLIEQRRWNATEIATMFGLPPYLVGGSTGDSLTYSTVEGEMIRLWTTALMPMATRLERAFSAWLPRGHRLRFVPDALLRSQTKDRYEAHKIGTEAGFLTVDEVRDLENRPPLTPAQRAALERDEHGRGRGRGPRRRGGRSMTETAGWITAVAVAVIGFVQAASFLIGRARP